MNPNLFKSTEFYHRRYHNFTTLLVFPLVLFVVFLVSFSFWAKKEIVVQAIGTVEATRIIALIQSTSDNPIMANYLTSNKVVKKGETLIKYTETTEISQKDNLQQKLDLLKRQETQLKILKSSLEQGSNLFQEDDDEFGYQSTFSTYVSQLDELETSVQNNDGGFVTDDTSISSKKLALKNQFLQEVVQRLSTLQSQIIDLEGKVNQAGFQLSSTQIQAPEDGILHIVQPAKQSTVVATGTELAQLYPNILDTREVLISYYVSSEYVSNLKKGQVVRLFLDKVGNHGVTIKGSIESIDGFATETEKGNVFRITAKAKLTTKEAQNIKYGLQGHVTSVIAKKTYFDYVKDKVLNQLN